MDFEKFWRRHRLVTDTAVGIAVSVCLVLPVSAQDTGTTDSHQSPGTHSAELQGGVDEGQSLLNEFTRDVASLATSFRQTRLDSNGELLEAESGTGQFSFLRPDRFRWHQDSPVAQTLVANGEFIWHYDVEYEQVRQGPYSDIAETPAALLSGQGDISDKFRVEELPMDGALRVLSLQPLESDAVNFESARIFFDEATPVMFELVDSLGELTRFEFLDVSLNPELAARDFEFVAPDGVRVITGSN